MEIIHNLGIGARRIDFIDLDEFLGRCVTHLFFSSAARAAKAALQMAKGSCVPSLECSIVLIVSLAL